MTAASTASPGLAEASPFHEAPVSSTETAWARLWASALNDPRDIVFINLGLVMTLVTWPLAIGLYVLAARGQFAWWMALPYWAIVGGAFIDRYILMAHCTMHRPLFTRRFRLLNLYIPWALGPLAGVSAESYSLHHIGMHHKEANLFGDLSTTMPFRRDRFGHWLRYWARFMTIGIIDLTAYHLRKGNTKLARRLVVNELLYWGGSAALAYFVSVPVTLVVFWLPILVVRTLMMAGNWGQHAFVDPDSPDNDFNSAITCINTRYNRRCFNDGYHIIHHLKPTLHYSEMADEFHKNRHLYAQNDAIVFEGLDFFEVWFCLMTGQKGKLARAFVRLPGAPARSDEEVIALIDRRMAPFSREARAA
ncbi:MAG TPA: fatty acid desaturase [Polyangiaceae bacterium]|nr:fatty acid desaturase [Polyangiaceae bacterium]